jgi:PPOX class probable F420-dependent enzyme
MTELTPEVQAAVTAGNLAHLVTLNPDGSPQISLVWVGLQDGEIVCGHLGDRQKLRNVRRDPRVGLSIQTGGRNEYGLDNYLVLTGTGRVSDGGGPELLQRLARSYLGPDAIFPPMPAPPPGYVLHIRVERVRGVGPWGAG